MIPFSLRLSIISLPCSLFNNSVIFFEDCKSVQEKIAEAIEIDHRLSSEPEPSDSSTDEEEENFTSTAHDLKEGEVN